MVISFAFFIVVIMLALSVLASAVCMGLWVHSDAKARELESPALWTTIAMLIPNFIGLVAYLIVRETRGKKPAPEEGEGPALKAKKSQKRFVRCLIAMAILFVLFIALLIGKNLLQTGWLKDSYSYSLRQTGIGTEHSASNVRISISGDVIDFQFGELDGQIALSGFTVRKGEAPLIVVEATEGDGAVSFALEQGDTAYALAHGTNSLSLGDGHWTIMAYGDDVQDGRFLIRLE